MLASGSQDETIEIWDVLIRQNVKKNYYLDFMPVLLVMPLLAIPMS